MRVFQCLECRKVESVPYALTTDERIMYCVCRNCGEPMIVGDCHDDDRLMANATDTWFITELVTLKERITDLENLVAGLQEPIKLLVESALHDARGIESDYMVPDFVMDSAKTALKRLQDI